MVRFGDGSRRGLAVAERVEWQESAATSKTRNLMRCGPGGEHSCLVTPFFGDFDLVTPIIFCHAMSRSKKLRNSSKTFILGGGALPEWMLGEYPNPSSDLENVSRGCPKFVQQLETNSGNIFQNPFSMVSYEPI